MNYLDYCIPHRSSENNDVISQYLKPFLVDLDISNLKEELEFHSALEKHLSKEGCSFKHEYAYNGESFDFMFFSNGERLPLEIKFRKKGQDSSHYPQRFKADVNKIEKFVKQEKDAPYGHAIFITDDYLLIIKCRVQCWLTRIQSISIKDIFVGDAKISK